MVLVSATLSGCSPRSEDAASPSGASSSSTAISVTRQSVPSGWQKIDKPEAGISIAVPPGWIDIDVNADDLGKALKEAGLAGNTAKEAERNLTALKKAKIAYMIFTRDEVGGYVKNINALCAPNGGIPFDQFENIARVGMARKGATDISVSELEIGGMPAIRISYTLSAANGADAVQFRTLMPGDKLCAVTFGSKRGEEIEHLDQIAQTIRPLE